MKVFRLENIYDGGGPWCTRGGRLRSNPNIIMDECYLFGCKSLNDLYRYIDAHEKVDLSQTHIAIYDIPDKEICFEERQVTFPKTYLPIGYLPYRL